jgi:hypothetical protein
MAQITDSQKLDRILETIDFLKEGFETLCKATQDIVDYIQPPGMPLRPGVEKKDPVKQPYQQASQNQNTAQKKPQHRNLIAELRDGDKKVYVEAEITELTAIREVNTASGPQELCDAVIADESGRIKLSLWGGDASKFRVGDEIVLENGYVSSYRGTEQLNVGKWGTLKLKKTEA